MDSQVMTNEATLVGHDIRCERCGSPATVHHEQELLCAVCYLKKKGKQIKQLDHTGYYP